MLKSNVRVCRSFRNHAWMVPRFHKYEELILSKSVARDFLGVVGGSFVATANYNIFVGSRD